MLGRGSRWALLAAMTLTMVGCGQSPLQVKRRGTDPFSPIGSGSALAEANPPTMTLDGAANYAAIERVVKEASHSIFIESFNFLNDKSGRELCDLLAARAKDGVKVRVIIDQIGNYFEAKSKSGVVAYLKERGVDARVYDWRSLGKGINITHRKLYMADGTRALTGGMNLTDEFKNERHDMLVEFRDTTVVHALHREFAYDWKQAGGAPFVLPEVPLGPSLDQVLVTSPAEQRFEIRDALYGAIRSATRRVEVESPYLSDDGLCKALLEARKRKVPVRILVPGANGSPIFKRLNSRSANDLMKAGAEIRHYDQRYSHVKYFAVDGNWALVGSANGDNRALSINQELSVAVREPALLKELNDRLFEADWAISTPITEPIDRPWYDWPFTSLLELVDYYI